MLFFRDKASYVKAVDSKPPPAIPNATLVRSGRTTIDTKSAGIRNQPAPASACATLSLCGVPPPADAMA